MPHQGKCFACGYKFKGAFELGFRSEFKKVEKDNLTPVERAVLRYRRESGKNYRLSEDVIKEFNLQISTRERNDKSGWYDVLSIPSDDILGYTKYLNYSGRWISVKASERDHNKKWTNLERIEAEGKQNQDFTFYFLAGEWDLFSFWKHTGLHGISPIDGESSPANFDREQYSFVANRHVVLFWDNDHTGYTGARAIANRIKMFHKVKSLKVVDLSRLGLDGGQDIDDYFAKGGTKERLFDEVERTPDFSGGVIQSNPELSRVNNPNTMPDYPDSVVDSETLLKLWDMAILPSARKDELLRQLAQSNGIGPKDMPEEIIKYKKEIDTLLFKAFDFIVDEIFNKLHVKQMTKNSDLEEPRYYYYDGDEGIYKYLTNEKISFVANTIAQTLTPPDKRKKLDEARNLAVKDFMVKIQKSPVVDFNNLPVEYINFSNGSLHLESNTLKPYSPEYLLTYRLPAKYDPESKCPRFDKALQMSFATDEERNEILKTYYYIISGIRNKEIAFWFYGGGLNGKTVFTNLARLLVGKERTSALPFEMLDTPHGTASLIGNILNIIEEVPKGYKMNDALWKRITGGALMYVNPKNKAPFGFINRAIPLVASNDLPYSSDTTHGFKRRFKFFKFKRIKESQVVHNFIDILESELDGITYKLLSEGRELYETDGFKETESSQEVLDEMLNKNPVRNYWSNVFKHAQARETEIMKDTYIDLVNQGISKEQAEKEAKIKGKEVWVSSPHEVDNIEDYTIVQKYSHKVKGEIFIVNTNKHYAIYKEHTKNDSAGVVSQSHFRKSTSDFILDKMKNIFSDTSNIEIHKVDALNITGKKRNIQLLMLKRAEQDEF